jgi:hypothetical protein
MNPEATYRSLLETSPHLLRHPHLLEAKMALEDYRVRKRYAIEQEGAGELESELMSKEEKQFAQDQFDALRDLLEADKQRVMAVFKMFEPEKGKIDKETLEEKEKTLDLPGVERVFEYMEFDATLVADVYDLVDTDRSGDIDVDELRVYIEMMGGIAVMQAEQTKRLELAARDRRAFELLGMLDDPSYLVRDSALEEFGDMGSASAFGQYFPDVFVNACVARFQDEDWRVRSTAAVTVARLGLRGVALGSSGVRELKRLDVDPRVRSAATDALARMYPINDGLSKFPVPGRGVGWRDGPFFGP